MAEQRRDGTPRLTLDPGPAACRLSAAQAATLYRRLREVDARQRAAARSGHPVPLTDTCRTQAALVLVEPLVTHGGPVSAALVAVLVALGVVSV